jgi:hypothetical protein
MKNKIMEQVLDTAAYIKSQLNQYAQDTFFIHNLRGDSIILRVIFNRNLK